MAGSIPLKDSDSDKIIATMEYESLTGKVLEYFWSVGIYIKYDSKNKPTKSGIMKQIHEKYPDVQIPIFDIFTPMDAINAIGIKKKKNKREYKFFNKKHYCTLNWDYARYFNKKKVCQYTSREKVESDIHKMLLIMKELNLLYPKLVSE